MSNFLGATGEKWASPIISAAELIAREGVNLTKGMNFRDRGEQLSVFLVLATHDGEFRDEWNPDSMIYVYEGHDSTTVESGKLEDQIAMYESGKATENGKFFKAANDFKDGVTKSPLQIQVYEKIDPGVWFDKGIFNLIDAMRVEERGRKVFKFHLMTAEAFETGDMNDEHGVERMLAAQVKADVWKRDGGHCAMCDTEQDLRFVAPSDYEIDADSVKLLCGEHRGGKVKRGMLG